MHDILTRWDDNGTGYISKVEWRRHIRALGIDAVDAELNALCALLMLNHSGPQFPSSALNAPLPRPCLSHHRYERFELLTSMAMGT